MIKKYVAVKVWDDNPDDFQVLEYFETIKATQEFIKNAPKDTGRFRSKFKYDIMVYDI